MSDAKTGSVTLMFSLLQISLSFDNVSDEERGLNRNLLHRDTIGSMILDMKDQSKGSVLRKSFNISTTINSPRHIITD